MIKKLKSSSDTAVSELARMLPRFNPNFITIAGLLPPALFFWLLVSGRPGWALLAFLGTVFDSVDGAYARATGQETKFGAFLDSNLDRLSDALIIAAFGFALIVPWELVVPTIIFSFLISYARATGTANTGNSKALAVGPVERGQRLGLIFLALVLFYFWPNVTLGGYNLMEIGFIILLALSVLTFMRRLLLAKNLNP